MARHAGYGKDTTGDYKRLDVRWLSRNGYLQPGSARDVQWKRGEQRIGDIRVRGTGDGVQLEYSQITRGSGDWTDMREPVRVTWTPCNFGGDRPWFICPLCSKRVAILYGGARFACRHCYGLGYGCQKEQPHDRALRRADAIRARLGWTPGTLNGIEGKPKGMHWRTYWTLVNEYHAHREASLAGILSLFARHGIAPPT